MLLGLHQAFSNSRRGSSQSVVGAGIARFIPEDGDGTGPWLFFFIEAVIESRVIKSLFTHRYAIRVPAGNRWCTQIRIILKRGVLIKNLIYIWEGRGRESQACQP